VLTLVGVGLLHALATQHIARTIKNNEASAPWRRMWQLVAVGAAARAQRQGLPHWRRPTAT
jgi:hypothetical protein